MKIQKKDIVLLRAFLAREARDFNFRGPGAALEYIEGKFQQIEALLDPIESADHVIINSLTNMGQVDRALTLTPEPWSHLRDVELNLPPNPLPNYRIGVDIFEPRRKYA